MLRKCIAGTMIFYMEVKGAYGPYIIKYKKGTGFLLFSVGHEFLNVEKHWPARSQLQAHPPGRIPQEPRTPALPNHALPEVCLS